MLMPPPRSLSSSMSMPSSRSKSSGSGSGSVGSNHSLEGSKQYAAAAASSSPHSSIHSFSSSNSDKPMRLFPSSYHEHEGDKVNGVGGGDDTSSVGTTPTVSDMSSASTFKMNPSLSSSRSPQQRALLLGTWRGVFLPCLSSILGVILFLRLTYITGQAGCVYTSVMILLSATSTLLTTLSLSAICTNGTMLSTGGPYYVISRTLGMEIGSTLGLLYALGLTLGCSMYVLGAVEALQRTIPIPMEPHYLALIIMSSLALVANIGVRYLDMATHLLLTIVMFSIISMMIGIVLFATQRSGDFGAFGSMILSTLPPLQQQQAETVISTTTDGSTIPPSSNMIYSSSSLLLPPQARVVGESWWPHYQPDPVTNTTPNFFSLMAMFYPSVTGFLAGSTRSSFLKDPATSIPKGTLAAIATTTLLYLSVVWLFGSVVSNAVLINDKFVTAAVAWPSDQVVAVGVIFCSIGAALQSFSGAPQVLAAIATDDALPWLRCLKPKTAVFHTSSNGNPTSTATISTIATAEPRRAIWFTLLLATLPTLAGNMDHISPFVTMFFLLMYAGINLSCFFLGVLKSPGFRPSFRYTHWSISLFGFVWCLGLVVLVVEDWHVTLGVLCASAILYAYTRRRAASQNWGDVGNALRYAIATTALRALSQQTTDFHAKNWRPQVLTVVDTDECGNPTNCQVLALAKQLKQGSGGIHLVMSVVQRPFNSGGLEHFETCELISHCKALLQQHMAYHDMTDCFAQVSAATASSTFGTSATSLAASSSSSPTSFTSSLRQAIWSAVLHSGLGVMSPNTVLLSYPNQTSARSIEQMDDFVATLRGIMNLNKAVILFKCASEYPPRELASSHKRIKSPSSPHPATLDIWWVVHDGGLLLLLPYILSRHPNFSKAQLRVFAVTTSTTENPERLERAVVRHLIQVRIQATVKVVDLSDTRIAEDMRENMDLNVSIWSASLHQDVPQRTNHSTVGEVFSQETYEVPYHAAATLDDVESGSGIFNRRQHQNSSGTLPVHVQPRGWLDEEDDAEGEEREKGSNSDSGGGSSDATFTTVRLRATALDAEERTRTARAFNVALQRYSRHAALVVTNMPLIRPDQPGRDFLDYVDTMCESIDNVLLVRGSGVEVITTYV